MPLNLQNHFLRAQGRIRVSQDEDESCLEVQVPEVLEKVEKAAGWKFNERGLLVGSLLGSRFVDPTFTPEMEDSPELMTTALVKRRGRWLMPEYCESMTKKEELDEQIFDDNTVIPSVTIFSYEPAPPEDMGFFAPGYKNLENRDERKTEVDYPYSTGEGGRRQKR